MWIREPRYAKKRQKKHKKNTQKPKINSIYGLSGEQPKSQKYKICMFGNMLILKICTLLTKTRMLSRKMSRKHS